MPIDLTEVRRSDSGRFCGPKAAYLGELKHRLPGSRRARPRGAVRRLLPALPERHRRAAGAAARAELATAGEPLPAFVERTYKQFFDVMIPAKTSEKELTAWIAPRLEIIRHSIRQAPLSAAVAGGDPRTGSRQTDSWPAPDQTVGCFVRSDTNVEDLDNFNGAGLNLTVFNRKSLDDIYAGSRRSGRRRSTSAPSRGARR